MPSQPLQLIRANKIQVMAPCQLSTKHYAPVYALTDLGSGAPGRDCWWGTAPGTDCCPPHSPPPARAPPNACQQEAWGSGFPYNTEGVLLVCNRKKQRSERLIPRSAYCLGLLGRGKRGGGHNIGCCPTWHRGTLHWVLHAVCSGEGGGTISDAIQLETVGSEWHTDVCMLSSMCVCARVWGGGGEGGAGHSIWWDSRK